MYPYFTLLGQSLGSIWLGIEALNSLLPGDIKFIDTSTFYSTVTNLLAKYILLTRSVIFWKQMFLAILNVTIYIY